MHVFLFLICVCMILADCICTFSLLDPSKPSQSDFYKHLKCTASVSGLLILDTTVPCAMEKMWKHLCGCTNILQILGYNGMWLTGFFACNVGHAAQTFPSSADGACCAQCFDFCCLCHAKCYTSIFIGLKSFLSGEKTADPVLPLLRPCSFLNAVVFWRFVCAILRIIGAQEALATLN